MEKKPCDISDSYVRLILYVLASDSVNLPATSLETHFLKKIDMALPADSSLLSIKTQTAIFTTLRR